MFFAHENISILRQNLRYHRFGFATLRSVVSVSMLAQCAIEIEVRESEDQIFNFQTRLLRLVNMFANKNQIAQYTCLRCIRMLQTLIHNETKFVSNLNSQCRKMQAKISFFSETENPISFFLSIT